MEILREGGVKKEAIFEGVWGVSFASKIGELLLFDSGSPLIIS